MAPSRRLSREVTDRGGHVDKYIGDNVMAVFGAPVAHEDDPERAVRAGLAMQAAMSEINTEIGGRAATSTASSWRCASASTPARCSPAGWADQYTVIGDTVNVAARLQAASGTGAVTVGAATRRLTRGRDRVPRPRAAGPEGQVPADPRLGGPGHRRSRRLGPGPARPQHRSSAVRRSSPSCCRCSSAPSRSRARTWSRSSGRRGSGSRGC